VRHDSDVARLLEWYLSCHVFPCFSFGQKKGPDRAGAASCARPGEVYVVRVSIEVIDSSAA
jgi:hypothetical protein